MMAFKVLSIFLSSFVILSCSNIKKQSVSEVKSVGAMHEMMMTGDTSGNLVLNKLKPKNLYGLGPLENLKGEITIVDGVPYVSRVSSDGQPLIQKDWTSSAIFFVYANSGSWEKTNISKALETKEKLNNILEKTLIAGSIHPEEKVLFKIRTKVKSLKYHIMNLKEGEAITHKNHKDAKKYYDLKDVQVEIVGFWAPKKMMGIYSHRGDRTHLHFISHDIKHSGHVDELSLYPDTEILISKKEKQF